MTEPPADTALARIDRALARIERATASLQQARVASDARHATLRRRVEEAVAELDSLVTAEAREAV